MRMRIGLVVGLTLCASLAGQEPAPGQEPAGPRQTSYADLAALGDAIESREATRDNVFLYKQLSEKIRQQAEQLPGASLSFTVAVMRVTEEEVYLAVPDAGDTRIAVKHSEPPPYGNLRTVLYSGSLSTHLAQILSKPITLRIGTEIDPEIAKGLRKGDLLLLKGRLETVHLLLEVFQPRAIAVISDVEVSQVNPSDPSMEYFFR